MSQYPGIFQDKTQEQVKADVADLRRAHPELWEIKLTPIREKLVIVIEETS